MIRIKLLIFIIISLQVTPLVSGDLRLPDRINENWVIKEPKRIFTGARLFDHINGAAELFLEFGFEDLTVCKYSNEDVTLELEVYKMENSLAALGIYLMKTGKETPLREIMARNSANNYQVVLTSGQYFILINNFSGNREALSSMIHLCEQVTKQIKIQKSDDLFRYLPKENMIRNSQVIFRGPYGLQSIFTFGRNDILLLGGKIFGVGANYTSKADRNITRLAIPYPDSNEALKAYHNLVSNLDTYLEILKKFENNFIFKDFNQEFGVVEIENNQILIQLHLSAKPD